jgi:P2-related tail formation protein
MWSSWVKEMGITQVIYIAKLKGGPKRVKKIFSMIWKRFLKWYDGGGENGTTSKRIFEVEVFISSQNIDFPFYMKRLLELCFFFQYFFFPPFLFFSMLCLLRTWGF